MSKHWDALRILGVYFYIQGAICVLFGLWLAYLTYDYEFVYDWKGDDSWGPGFAVIGCLVGTVYFLPFGLVSLLGGSGLCRRRWFIFCRTFAVLELFWAAPLVLWGWKWLSTQPTDIWGLLFASLPWPALAAAILALWTLCNPNGLESFRRSPR